MAETRFCSWCGRDLVKRTIDGVERAVCPSSECGYVFWDNPTPVVAAIVEMDGCVILIQNKGWPEKLFGLVSGFLEMGETPEQGIEREIAEELSLECERVELLGLYPFFERNQLIIAYHVVGRGVISPGDEIAQYRAVPVERLRPWSFGTGPAVKDWLERRG